jgi:hypothetical protein
VAGGAPLLALFEKGPPRTSHQGIGQAADARKFILTLSLPKVKGLQLAGRKRKRGSFPFSIRHKQV